MYIQIAWRNIWRNPRRTVVILIAIVIGIWAMVFLGALMRGMIVSMIDNGISTLTGHIQIHEKNYRDDPVVENSISDPEKVAAALEGPLPPGSQWTARVSVGAVASNARHSSGVTLVGIDPETEARVSFIGKAVTSGEYLKPDDDHGVLVGRALLEKYETRIGHKLVLMSQDMDKEIASVSFKIVGVYDAEMESTEKTYVFITRSAAQKMLKMGGAVSEFSILLPENKGVEEIAEKITQALNDPEYKVETWLQLKPILRAYFQIFDGYMMVWFVVVFIAMGFGIVNTTLMAVFERMREFGLLKALGMKPWRIIRSVVVETFFLLLIGLFLGNLISYLSALAASGGLDLSALAAGADFAGMPRIIYPVITAYDLITANLVVFVLGLLVSLYPAFKAAGFTPVEAMTRT